MKKFTGRIIAELIGGGIAMVGAVIAAISSQSEKAWIGVYVGIGCILLGWAAFTISQVEEK